MQRARISYGRQFSELESNYNLPNDSEEYARLNLQHEALKLQAGGNFKASIEEKDIRNILDICCGSGQWAIDMAESFPNALVTGIDISIPRIIPECKKPQNCSFQHADVKKPLPFADDSFDFVQMRTVPSLPNRTHLMSEITRVLRPGGVIQLIEPYESFSQTLTAGRSKPFQRSPKLVEVDRYLSKLPHAAHSLDQLTQQLKSWSIAPQLYLLVSEHEEDGKQAYTDVHTAEVILPVGPWPTDPVQRRIGADMASVQIGLLDGFRAPLLESGLLSAEDFEKLSEDVTEEIYQGSGIEGGWKICFPFVWVWGTKV